MYTTQYIFKELFQGFGVTLNIFFWTLLFAIPLGLLICFFTMSKFKPLSYFSKFFVWVIRGTPLMLQVIFIFYGFDLMGIRLTNFFRVNIVKGFDNSEQVLRTIFVIIAFVINYAVYFSEIYRGGIQSISRGQYEAAHMLGLTKTQTFKTVVAPQVIKRIVPPMSNEILTLVKDTSLARVIAVVEIIRAAESIMANTGKVWPLLSVAIFYLIFNGILTLLLGRLEKRLGYYR